MPELYGVPYLFWILAAYQIHYLKILSSIPWVALSFYCSLFVEKGCGLMWFHSFAFAALLSGSNPETMIAKASVKETIIFMRIYLLGYSWPALQCLV